MSKMSELSTMIDSLIECGQKLIDVGNGLKEFYSEPAPKSKALVESEKLNEGNKAFWVCFEEVRKILAEKSSVEDGKYKAEVPG